MKYVKTKISKKVQTAESSRPLKGDWTTLQFGHSSDSSALNHGSFSSYSVDFVGLGGALVDLGANIFAQ